EQPTAVRTERSAGDRSLVLERANEPLVTRLYVPEPRRLILLKRLHTTSASAISGGADRNGIARSEYKRHQFVIVPQVFDEPPPPGVGIPETHFIIGAWVAIALPVAVAGGRDDQRPILAELRNAHPRVRDRRVCKLPCAGFHKPDASLAVGG